MSVGVLWRWGRRHDFELNRAAERRGQRLGVPIGGPELEIGVAVRREPHLEQVTGFHDLHVADYLRVAAVEALGQAHDRAEQPDRLPLARAQLAELLVALLGLRLPMIPGGE